MTGHNPFEAADRLAPVPATRDNATADAWVRHYAALSLAAFTEYRHESLAGFGQREPGSRPDLGYLAGMAVAAMAAAVAADAKGAPDPHLLWDLTPECGAFNGEWEEWLVDTLDALGVNPADINPAYNAGDFTSPTVAVTA